MGQEYGKPGPTGNTVISIVGTPTVAARLGGRCLSKKNVTATYSEAMNPDSAGLTTPANLVVAGLPMELAGRTYRHY